MKKKILSLLVVSAMLGSLMGCGSRAPETKEPEKTAGSSQTTDAQTADGAQADGQEQAVNPDEWPTITVQIPVLSEMPDEQMVEDALNEYLVSINAGVKADMVQIGRAHV